MLSPYGGRRFGDSSILTLNVAAPDTEEATFGRATVIVALYLPRADRLFMILLPNQGAIGRMRVAPLTTADAP